MAYAVPQLTDYGMSLLVRAVGGETITFTRMAIGNGDVPAGTDPTSLNNLINEQLSFGIASIEAQDAYNVRIIGRFDSTQIQNDFRWKEIGVFCVGEKTQSFSGNGSTKTFTITDKPASLNYVSVSGSIVTISSYNSSTGVVTLASAPASGTNNVMVSYPDYEHEKLYAYSNDGNNAGMLKANASDVTAEQSLALIIEVGRASSVTAIIAPSVLYVQQAEFDTHLQATNPHGITKETIGLGNVPNVTINNQTPTYSTPSASSNLTSGETMSTAFGKIARAIMNLISHISNHNNPHGDTPASIGAASAEHTHSAADMTLGVLSTIRGGTGKSSWSKNGIVHMNSSNNGFAQATVPSVESFLVQNNGAPYWIPTSSIGKRTVKYVVGTTAAGHKATDCDYLCTGADDQVVINRALSALPSTGGTVYLLDGTYNTTGDITLSKTGTTLTGGGAARINLGTTGSAGYSVKITANACTVRDIYIIGNINPTNGVYAYNVSRALITGVRGKNMCICCDTCTNSIVTANFSGESNGYNTAFHLLGGSGNILSNNNASGAWYCIRVENEKNITVANNVVLSANEYGIYGSGCSNISISGNSVYSNVGGLTTGCYFTTCKNITFTTNTVQLDSGASGDTTTFSSCQKVLIIGNTFKNTVSSHYALKIASCSYILHTHNIHMAYSSSYYIYTSGNSNYQQDYNLSITETT